MINKMWKLISLALAAVLLACTLSAVSIFTVSADTVWDYSLNANNYIDISDAAAFKASDLPTYEDVRGFRFSNGTKTTGWVVFDAQDSYNNFMVSAILYNTTAAAQANLQFEVSSDKENWTPVSAVPNRTNLDRSSWPTFDYWAFTDTPFRYVRVNFVGAASNYDPAICKIHFRNLPDDTKPDYYSVKVSAINATADSEGEIALSSTESPGYYNFQKDGLKVAGSLTWKSDYPITYFNFTTLVSNTNWLGKVEFKCSKDGINFEPLSVTTVKTSAHSNTAWSASYFDNYGMLPASENYKYLRAEFVVTNTRVILPAISYLEYSYSMAALTGDANRDFEVDLLDLVSIKKILNTESEYDKYIDFNLDGEVNSEDFNIFRKYLLGVIESL